MTVTCVGLSKQVMNQDRGFGEGPAIHGQLVHHAIVMEEGIEVEPADIQRSGQRAEVIGVVRVGRTLEKAIHVQAALAEAPVPHDCDVMPLTIGEGRGPLHGINPVPAEQHEGGGVVIPPAPRPPEETSAGVGPPHHDFIAGARRALLHPVLDGEAAVGSPVEGRMGGNVDAGGGAVELHGPRDLARRGRGTVPDAGAVVHTEEIGQRGSLQGIHAPEGDRVRRAMGIRTDHDGEFLLSIRIDAVVGHHPDRERTLC